MAGDFDMNNITTLNNPSVVAPPEFALIPNNSQKHRRTAQKPLGNRCGEEVPTATLVAFNI
jgi:hypothetical protein